MSAKRCDEHFMQDQISKSRLASFLLWHWHHSFFGSRWVCRQ